VSLKTPIVEFGGLFECDNCYAYLTIGFEFELDISIFDGVKVFKSIFFGRAAAKFDPRIVVNEIQNYYTEYVGRWKQVKS
jgi:hypothetical protein